MSLILLFQVHFPPTLLISVMLGCSKLSKVFQVSFFDMKELENCQGVIEIGNKKHPDFFLNSSVSNDGKVYVWVSCIASKDSANKYKYNIKMKHIREDDKKPIYLVQETQQCVPCDLAHNDVKVFKRGVSKSQLTKALTTKATRAICQHLDIDVSIQRA